MPDTDLYEALGVGTNATQDEIKRAYRKLARKYHPDVNPGPDADAKFKAASAAHDVLRDPEKRAAYDKYGADWENPPQPRGPEGWQTGYGFAPEDMSRADASAFEDFFNAAFHQQARRADQHARLMLDLEDLFDGGSKALSLRLPEMDSSGRVVWKERRIDVNVPKGVMPGQHIRLRGQGADGGDLLLEIGLRPHPIFRVDGRDISVDLPVTPWEAALGANIPMPTPGGKVQLKVPENARTGQKLRLRGRGLPGAKAGGLYATILIMNPPVKTAEARALYERMAKELRFDPRKNQGV